MRKTKLNWLAGCGLLLMASHSWSVVSQAEADKLGTTLTPMGANPAGNAEGTIPKWTGSILGVPRGVNYKGTGTHYPTPYPDEKQPMFVITGKNYTQYLKNLTEIIYFNYHVVIVESVFIMLFYCLLFVYVILINLIGI